MASPLPTFQYLVAFNNNALDDPALITTVAAPGVLGANNVWTDITQYVAGHQISRGRQHELSRFEAGTCTLDLKNDDGRFNPWNSQGPYYGKLTPMRPMQVRATYAGTTYTRFTGSVAAWPVQWPDNFSSMAQVQGVDGFRVLALANITNSQYKQTVLADAPIAYYRLGDSGAVAVDSSGNGNNGLYIGAGTQGLTGALSTDPDLAYSTGDHQGYVTLPGAVGFGNTFAFECFAQFPAQPNSNNDRFWSQADATATTYAILGPYAGTGANIGLFIDIDDATHRQLYQTNAVLPLAGDGKWHHIVMTRSGGSFNIYLDGVAQTVVMVVDTGTVSFASATRAGMCRSISTETPAANLLIDEVAVYGGVLPSGRVLAHYNASRLPGVQSGARVGAILDIVGWSAGARNIDTGDTALQSSTANLTTTKTLAHLQAVEQTEDGALFMTGDGKVRFVSRSNQVKSPYNTAQSVYGDNPVGGEIPWQPSPDLALDDLDLWNEAIVANNGGVAKSASDATSITLYGRRTQNLSGLFANTDAYSLQRAQWLVTRFKSPVTRLRSIVVNPMDSPSTAYAATLGRELLDRVLVARAGVPGVSDPFVLNATVERIDEAVTPDSWAVTYALANALPPVGLYNDTVYGRYSDSSPLAGTITAGATSLSVTIAAGAPAWTTNAGDWPFPIQVDGEQMTVTAIAAVSGGAQVLTVARGVNRTTATAHTAGALVTPVPACVYGF